MFQDSKVDRGRGGNQGDRADHEHNQDTGYLGSLLGISLQDNMVDRELGDMRQDMAILDNIRGK